MPPILYEIKGVSIIFWLFDYNYVGLYLVLFIIREPLSESVLYHIFLLVF